MTIVTPAEWPSKVWTAADVSGFDPDEQLDLIKPFLQAVAERIKSVHAIGLRNDPSVSASKNADTYASWSQFTNSSSNFTYYGPAGGDLFGTPNLRLWKLDSPDAYASTRIYPLWSPVRKLNPHHIRSTPFYQGATIESGLAQKAPGASTADYLPNPYWLECYDGPATWPDRWFKDRYNYLFSTAGHWTTASGSTARDTDVRDNNAEMYRHLGTYYPPTKNNANNFFWFHGYPASSSSATPTGEDLAASRGRILHPGEFYAFNYKFWNAANDADLLTRASGWAYVQTAAWALRKYFLWAACPYRNFTTQGVGSQDIFTGVPLRRFQDYTSGSGGSFFDFPDAQVPMRYWAMPFTRKHPRIIHRLDEPGQAGWVAEFRVYKGSDRFLASRPDAYPYDVKHETPADQYKHGGKLFTYTSGAWTESTAPDAVADIVTAKGLIREGDLFGEWILNDLHDFINLLVCTVGWVVPEVSSTLLHYAASAKTFGDPWEARPSFLIRMVPAWLPQNTSQTPAGRSDFVGRVAYYFTRSRNSSFTSLPLSATSQIGLAGTHDTPTNNIVNPNILGPARQLHTAIVATNPPDRYGPIWDKTIKVEKFNSDSNGIARRVEVNGAISNALGIGTLTMIKGGTAAMTVDGTAVYAWIKSKYGTSVGHTPTDDELKGVTFGLRQQVKCWWDVDGGYEYVASVRSAVGDAMTVT